jgi:hypothetical protein
LSLRTVFPAAAGAARKRACLVPPIAITRSLGIETAHRRIRTEAVLPRPA